MQEKWSDEDDDKGEKVMMAGCPAVSGPVYEGVTALWQTISFNKAVQKKTASGPGRKGL